ncbi:MAG: sensor histidine kinase [Synechococcales cyanobacterium K44_A2020_017]|nr:sensor histidine kinase [Synechococcales cyanobacterium K32_A2020_035]MBF2096298.1 sensor histidine kinase [Synechococcales cyanobacterium K44_A2020_017]
MTLVITATAAIAVWYGYLLSIPLFAMTVSACSSQLRRTIRWVEWFILGSSLIQNWLSSHLETQAPSLLWAYLFGIVFWVFSLSLPLTQPLCKRRVYVFLQLVLILAAFAWEVWLELLLYFVLVKSCFLLPRREVIFATLLAGIGEITITAQWIPGRIDEIVTQIQAGQVEAIYNFRVILVSNVVNYLGISFFAVCFGLVMVAERQSRLRAEALSQQVEAQAVALERARIARDIHDGLGHSLSTLSVQLELIQRLTQQEPVAAAGALSIAQQLTHQCLQDVRLSVQTMRQRNFNLNQAIRELIEQIHALHRLKIDYHLKLPVLSPQMSHQLYCILQEGLTNIQKHAQANQVQLRGYATSSTVWLELRDDGVGFDLDGVLPGFGLRGMYERTQLLRGQLKVQSRAGEGTFIQVCIPR